MTEELDDEVLENQMDEEKRQAAEQMEQEFAQYEEVVEEETAVADTTGCDQTTGEQERLLSDCITC